MDNQLDIPDNNLDKTQSNANFPIKLFVSMKWSGG